MKKSKAFLIANLSIGILLGSYTSVCAKVDTYTLITKDGQVYEYNKDEVIDAAIQSHLGFESKLFEDFNLKLSKGSFHSYHTDSGKYVSHNEIVKKLLEQADSNNFSLDEEAEKLSKLDITEEVYRVSDKNGKLINTPVKAKDQSTYKDATFSEDLYVTGDKIVLQRVKVNGTLFVNPGAEGTTNLEDINAGNIVILSGAKNSIHLKNVVSQSLQIQSTSVVRIESSGTTKIENTVVSSSSILDAKEGSFGQVSVAIEPKKGDIANNTDNTKGNKESTIEFRGKFDKEIVIKSDANIKAAKGAEITKLEIATEKKENKIVLSGDFKDVVVNKEAKIEVAKDAKIANILANANVEIAKDKEAVIPEVKKGEGVEIKQEVKEVAVVEIKDNPTDSGNTNGSTGNSGSTSNSGNTTSAGGSGNTSNTGNTGNTGSGTGGTSNGGSSESDNQPPVINNSSLDKSTAAFDKKSAAQADVPIVISLNGNTLRTIKNGTVTLTANTDYTVNGSNLVLKKEYLASKEIGKTTLTFEFSAGVNRTLEITISDTTDNTAPIVTAAVQNATNVDGQTVNVQSNEATGYVYIIKEGEPQATVSDFETAISGKKAAKSKVVGANADIAISTKDLVAGMYYAYAVDGEGNISTKGSNGITITAREEEKVLSFSSSDPATKFEVQDNNNRIEVTNNVVLPKEGFFNLFVTPPNGKALLSYKVLGVGGYGIGFAGEAGRIQDELSFNTILVNSSNPSVEFNYVNSPDMNNTIISSTPGLKGSKSINIKIEAYDSQNIPINGIESGDVSLTLKDINNNDVWIPLSNYKNSSNYNIYGVKAINFDQDETDNILSFTLLFTNDDLTSNSDDKFTNISDGSEINFAASVLRVIKTVINATLPASIDESKELEALKAEALVELNGYKLQADYSIANWKLIEDKKLSGAIAINAAATTEAVETALTVAKADIDTVKNLAQENLEVDQATAETVIIKINNLPVVTELVLEDKELIVSARAAYDALSDAQKLLVTNLAKLIQGEERIAEIEADIVVDVHNYSNASFVANDNIVYITVTGKLTDAIDVNKLKYLTSASGEYSYKLAGQYSKINTTGVLEAGQYHYYESASNTTILIKLTDSDAHAIKNLIGYGNDSVDINDSSDRLVAEEYWCPNGTSGIKAVYICNRVTIINNSSKEIASGYAYNGNKLFSYWSTSPGVAPGKTFNANIGTQATKIVFYVGSYTPNVVPTTGEMKIINVNTDILNGITLDDSNWISVTENNFGVDIADTTAPTITLIGGKVTINLNEIYAEPGYSANDNVDGNITANVIVNGNIDVTKAGTYTLTYNVKDSANNSAVQVTRKVTVVDTANKEYTATSLNKQIPDVWSAGTVNGNVTIVAGEGTYSILKDTIINGNLIMRGVDGKGGSITLQNVQVNGQTGNDGKVIVEEVGENSLYFDGVKADIVEVKDTNGARIVTDDTTVINTLDINPENETAVIKLQGDFNAATVNVQSAATIGVDDSTSITKVVSTTDKLSIVAPTSDPADNTATAAASIGTIEGAALSQEMISIQQKAEEYQDFIDTLIVSLNELAGTVQENVDDFLQRGQAARKLLEEQTVFELGEDYYSYDEYTRVRTANTVRSQMKNGGFTTINQLKKAFEYAKKMNIVFAECRKYLAYEYPGKTTEVPKISKDVEIGTDVTDIVLAMNSNTVKNENVKVQVSNAIKSYEDYTSDSNTSEYLIVENGRIKLIKKNDSNSTVKGIVKVKFIDDINIQSSTTLLNVNIEPTLAGGQTPGDDNTEPVKVSISLSNLLSISTSKDLKNQPIDKSMFKVTVNGQEVAISNVVMAQPKLIFAVLSSKISNGDVVNFTYSPQENNELLYADESKVEAFTKQIVAALSNDNSLRFKSTYTGSASVNEQNSVVCIPKGTKVVDLNNIFFVSNGSFRVYNSNNVNVPMENEILADYIIVAEAQDGTTKNYKITVDDGVDKAVDVSSEGELIAAISDNTVDIINIKLAINFTAPVTINRKVTINGNNLPHTMMVSYSGESKAIFNILADDVTIENCSLNFSIKIESNNIEELLNYDLSKFAAINSNGCKNLTIKNSFIGTIITGTPAGYYNFLGKASVALTAENVNGITLTGNNFNGKVNLIGNTLLNNITGNKLIGQNGFFADANVTKTNATTSTRDEIKGYLLTNNDYNFMPVGMDSIKVFVKGANPESVFIEEKDVTKPVITLKGTPGVVINSGSQYVEPGVIAIDGRDGNISANVITTITNKYNEVVDAIDTSKDGMFTIHYNVTDAAGNKAPEIIRLIHISGLVSYTNMVVADENFDKVIQLGLGGAAVPVGESNISFSADLSADDLVLGGDFAGLTIESVIIDSANANPMMANVRLKGSLTYETGIGTITLKDTGIKGASVEYDKIAEVVVNDPNSVNVINPINNIGSYLSQNINLWFDSEIKQVKDLSNIKIKNSKGEEVAINNIWIDCAAKQINIYSRSILSGKYSLAIPANTISNISGEKSNRDINIQLNVDLPYISNEDFKNLIGVCQSSIKFCKVGTNAGEVPQNAVTNLQAAINSTKIIANNTISTKAEREIAYYELMKAQSIFMNSMIKGLFSNTENVVANANFDQVVQLNVLMPAAPAVPVNSQITNFAATLNKTDIELGGDFTEFSIESVTFDSVNPWMASIRLKGNLVYGTGIGTITVKDSGWNGPTEGYDKTVEVKINDLSCMNVINNNITYATQSINLTFDKNIQKIKDWSNMKLKNSIGEEITINNVWTDTLTKQVNIISNSIVSGRYSLFIPANTISDESGQIFNKDINIQCVVQLPTKSNAELLSSINNFEVNTLTLPVGNNAGQYPQSALDNAKNAIAIAKNVVNNNLSTNSEIESAYYEFMKEQNVFYQSMVPGLLTNPKTVLAKAGFDQVIQLNVIGSAIPVDPSATNKGCFAPTLSISDIELGGDFAGLTIESLTFDSTKPWMASIRIKGDLTYTSGTGTITVKDSGWTGPTEGYDKTAEIITNKE